MSKKVRNQEDLPVTVAGENGFAAVAAVDDVADCPRISHSEFSGHRVEAILHDSRASSSGKNNTYSILTPIRTAVSPLQVAGKNSRLRRHPSCALVRRFSIKTYVTKKKKQICGFGRCPQRNWSFHETDTVRGTPPPGVPESVPLKAYQCLLRGVSRSRLFSCWTGGSRGIMWKQYEIHESAVSMCRSGVDAGTCPHVLFRLRQRIIIRAGGHPSNAICPGQCPSPSNKRRNSKTGGPNRVGRTECNPTRRHWQCCCRSSDIS